MKKGNNSNDEAITTTVRTTKPTKTVCRAFLRGLCRRDYCEYPHVTSPNNVIFCHDFQNQTCTRPNCKFLHYTIEDEEFYRRNAKFPRLDQRTELIERCVPPPPPPPTPPRSGRFLPQHNFTDLSYNTMEGIYPSDHSFMAPTNVEYSRNTRPSFTFLTKQAKFQSNCQTTLKRKAFASSGEENAHDMSEQSNTFQNSSADNSTLTAVVQKLCDEVSTLKKRCETSEVKVAELTAICDYLMVENKKLHLNSVEQQKQQHQCNSLFAVARTSLQHHHQQQQQPQQSQQTATVTAVSIAAPVVAQLQTPIVSVATPSTQILVPAASTASPLTSHQVQQQLVMAAAAHQTQMNSLAAAVVSSAAASAQHQLQLGTTSQITLAPASITQGTSMGLTINTSQSPLAISQSTQPIISYPVMTHSILQH